MKTFLFLMLSVLTATAADVKISELPAATTPSTNSWTIISDMDAATKSQKYLITNWVLQATLISATNNVYTSAQAFANGLTNTTVLMATNSSKSYADATFFTLGATNAYAAGLTNLAKDYADSLTNTVVLMSTNSAKDYADATFLPLAGGTVDGDLSVTGDLSVGSITADTVINTTLTSADIGFLSGIGTDTNWVVGTLAMWTNTAGIFDEDGTKFVGGDGALHAFSESLITNGLARAIGGTGPITSGDSTDTFTNKTLDAAGTGNVLKQRKSFKLSYPRIVDGAGCVFANTNNYAAVHFLEPKFTDDAATNANYCRFGVRIPSDIDTSVDLTATLTIELGGADTAAHIYHLGMVSIAGSAAAAGTAANFVVLDVAADGSGADGDIENSGSTTLTDWKSNVTAGQWWLIELRRNGVDDSTVDSYLKELEIFYTSTQ